MDKKTITINEDSRPMVRIIASHFDENMANMPKEKRHAKAI